MQPTFQPPYDTTTTYTWWVQQAIWPIIDTLLRVQFDHIILIRLRILLRMYEEIKDKHGACPPRMKCKGNVK